MHLIDNRYFETFLNNSMSAPVLLEEMVEQKSSIVRSHIESISGRQRNMFINMFK